MTTDQHLRRIGNDGFTIFEDVVPRDEVEAVCRSVYESANRYCDSQVKADLGVIHVSSFINQDQSYAPYLADRRILDVAEALFGAHVRVSFTSATVNEPGKKRDKWHADWPFNQLNAGHIPAPYADACIHLTSLWMFSPFTAENGGTLVVPGSHRVPTNPTADMGVDPTSPYPTEFLVTGEAGSVVMFDSRVWHSANANRSSEPRVSVVVRYAPWYLNLNVLRPDSEDRKRMVDESGGRENCLPAVPRGVYENLPDQVKPLFRHWVEQTVAQSPRAG